MGDDRRDEPVRDCNSAYIAGPMRGYPRHNFGAFDEAQATLEAAGWMVISPAAMDREIGFDPDRDTLESFDFEAAFDRDVAAIRSVGAVVLLPGHERSTGATAERHLAKWLKKRVLIYPSLDEFDPTADVLNEALSITTGDRNESYGPPDADFRRTAILWGAILDCEVDAKDVALCMIMLKCSRAKWAAARDNWVDIAGYARCGWICEGSEAT